MPKTSAIRSASGTNHKLSSPSTKKVLARGLQTKLSNAFKTSKSANFTSLETTTIAATKSSLKPATPTGYIFPKFKIITKPLQHASTMKTESKSSVVQQNRPDPSENVILTTTTQIQQEASKQEISIQSNDMPPNGYVAPIKTSPEDALIGGVNILTNLNEVTMSASNSSVLPYVGKPILSDFQVSSASRQAMEKLLLESKSKDSEMASKEEESKFPRMANDDSLNKFKTSELNNENFIGNYNNESKNIYTKPEMKMDTDVPFQNAIIDLFNIIAKNIPKPVFILFRNKNQNTSLLHFHSYVLKKTQFLLAKYSNKKKVSFAECQNDFFSADAQSILLFKEFYKMNENILWMKINSTFVCLICKASCNFRISILDHLNIHYRHFHICTVCKRQLSSKRSLQHHTNLRHKVP